MKSTLFIVALGSALGVAFGWVPVKVGLTVAAAALIGANLLPEPQTLAAQAQQQTATS